jgi:hypothetical protein
MQIEECSVEFEKQVACSGSLTVRRVDSFDCMMLP